MIAREQRVNAVTGSEQDDDGEEGGDARPKLVTAGCGNYGGSLTGSLRSNGCG